MACCRHTSYRPLGSQVAGSAVAADLVLAALLGALGPAKAAAAAQVLLVVGLQGRVGCGGVRPTLATCRRCQPGLRGQGACAEPCLSCQADPRCRLLCAPTSPTSPPNVSPACTHNPSPGSCLCKVVVAGWLDGGGHLLAHDRAEGARRQRLVRRRHRLQSQRAGSKKRQTTSAQSHKRMKQPSPCSSSQTGPCYGMQPACSTCLL